MRGDSNRFEVRLGARRVPEALGISGWGVSGCVMHTCDPTVCQAGVQWQQVPLTMDC